MMAQGRPWHQTMLLFITVVLISVQLLRLYKTTYREVEPTTLTTQRETSMMKQVISKSNVAGVDTFLRTHKKTFLERNQQLFEYCSQNRHLESMTNVTHLLHYHMILLREHRLVYCPNAKTGTSTWMEKIAKLSDFPKELLQIWKENILLHPKMKLWYHYPDLEEHEQRQIFNHYFSFTFVRHPFVRLASTYQDKVIDFDHNQWPILIPKNYTEVPRISRQYPEKPTFSEFVDYLLAGGTEGDVHTQTFVSKCAMCSLQYDAIGMLETAADDFRYITEASGIQDSSHPEHVSSGGSTTDLAKQYFATLSRKQFLGLKAYYKDDLLAFGYDPEAFSPDMPKRHL